MRTISRCDGKPDAVKDGLTGDQRFFISFGQSWRSKVRDAELRREIATDGHAPEQYRADTVRNLDAWYPAFSVQPSQKLYLAPDIACMCGEGNLGFTGTQISKPPSPVRLSKRSS